MEQQVDIAVLNTELKNLKDGFSKMETKMDNGFVLLADKIEMMNANYVKRDEFVGEIRRINDELKKVVSREEYEKQVDDLKECDDKKLDSKDFEPLRNNLNKLAWLIIGQIVVLAFGGIAFLVVHFASK